MNKVMAGTNPSPSLSSAAFASGIHPELLAIDVKKQEFRVPEKCIQTHADVETFTRSPGYTRLIAFLDHLNASVSPLASQTPQNVTREDGFARPVMSVERFYTNCASIEVSPEVQGVINILSALKELVSQCPPSTGPRRFGNVAYREWYHLAIQQTPILIDKFLPLGILQPNSHGKSAKLELNSYLIGSFGSQQRLDYGTGHELSFLAFLCGVWVLGGFAARRDEQALVLRVFPSYLDLIRTLVRTYTLEPAGSHGVWGLDDHSFLPYIFGSSQLTTEAPSTGREPNYAQYSIPKPGDVTNKAIVDAWRERNLYFEAIGFIYDVKKGSFWEHSPILYDISGVREGWGKINMVLNISSY